MTTRIQTLMCAWCLPVLLVGAAPGDSVVTTQPTGIRSEPTTRPVSSQAQLGGEPDSVVQVANLIYAGNKSSRCFSDHFLVQAEKESTISTSRRFHAVKLSSEELFSFPLVIMTGEGAFVLTEQERANLRRFIERDGFLLASAGCSSQEWEQSFRAELSRVFPEYAIEQLSLDHAMFHTVYDINSLQTRHGSPRPIEGMVVNGHVSVVFSQEGLNDTEHAQGCCCCGGNEITNAVEVNVNILAYVLTY